MSVSSSSECCVCAKVRVVGGWLHVSAIYACDILSIVFVFVHAPSMCVWCNHMFYVWFVTTTNVFSFVCLAICDSDRHADMVAIHHSVSKSCVKRWLRYTCLVRHHELTVVCVTGQPGLMRSWQQCVCWSYRQRSDVCCIKMSRSEIKSGLQ